MGSDVYLQIKLKYNTFSEAQKKLADFVTSNPNFVLNQSISEVAEACNVGEATISRFCRTLGYKGYHDFKLSIVKYLPKDEPSEILGDVITHRDSISSMARVILSKEIEALNETCSLIKDDDIKKAVDLLTSANRILFFGAGASLAIALDGCNKFMRITPNVSINIESHMQYVAASLLSERDVAVIISYSGSTKEIVEVAKTAKNRDAKIICITRYLKSPLTHYSDISLLCSTSERIVHGYSLSMELAQIFIMNVLYTEFVRRNYEISQKNKEDSSLTLSDKLF
jgi:DNA-binding MurR/RpiR family transcriptional regulator